MKRLGFLLTLSVLLAAGAASAGGFLIYEHGAPGTGMASARTASSDHVSALYFNPAAITELPGLQLALGFTGILPYAHYEPAPIAEPRTYPSRDADGNLIQAPVLEDGTHPVDAKIKGFTPIHLYATYQIGETGITVGYGLNNPFGLGTFWPGDWDGRFLATETELKTFFNQPTVAVDLAKLLGFKDTVKLSVAAGYDFVYGQALLSQHIDLRVAEAFDPDIRGPEGVMQMIGSAIGHGWNAALYAELPKLLSFGASVRGGFNGDGSLGLPFEGTAKFSFNPAGELAKTSLGLAIPDETDGTVTIDLPLSMNFGVAYLGIEKLKIEFDFYVSFFQSYDELNVQFACALGDEPECPVLKQDPIVKNFKESMQFALGAEYWITDAIAARVGYGLVTNPVPEDTYGPDLPDGRRDLLCVGGTYKGDWYRADLGYMLAMWEGEKNNDVGAQDASGNPKGKANGTYTTFSHLLGVTWAMNF